MNVDEFVTKNVVSVAGMPYTIIEKEDNFDFDTHYGMIDYRKCEIILNKDMHPLQKEQSLMHEMLHGILVQIGFTKLAQDEEFIQCLSNALWHSFKIRGWEIE